MNIREIAKRCNVSVGTVSHVLNGRPGVKKEARQKILRLVKQLNYDPADNVAAVQKVKKNVIKAILPYGVAEIMTSPFYNKALVGLKMQATKDGSEVMIAHEHDFRKTIAAAKGNYRLSNAAGLVFICPQQEWGDEMEKFCEAGVAVGLVNRETQVKGVISAMDKREDGIRQILEHIKGHGVTSAACFNAAGLRLPTVEIVQEEAERLDLNIININDASNAWDVLLERLMEMREKKIIPEALICFGDMMALRAIKHLQRWGYRVPEDIIVTGYDNVPAATYIYPELTTVDCPIDKMTGFVGKRVLEKINDPDIPGTETMFNSELIIRESCGCGDKNREEKEEDV